MKHKKKTKNEKYLARLLFKHLKTSYIWATKSKTNTLHKSVCLSLQKFVKANPFKAPKAFKAFADYLINKLMNNIILNIWTFVQNLKISI